MPTKSQLVEINEKLVINFASATGIQSKVVSGIAEAVFREIKRRLKDAGNELMALTQLLALLSFGEHKSLWEFIKYDILGIPYGRYIHGKNQPVLHCPKCGAAGKPNGTTKSGKHQYVCHACSKSFTEYSSAEYKIFRYFLMLKALQLLKSGLSITLISLILGISRLTLATELEKIDYRRIRSIMNSELLAAINSTVSDGKYALLILDATFVGGTAVILLMVDHGNISMYIAESEKKKYIEKSLMFLANGLDESLHKNLIFLSDGSVAIFKAVRKLFPKAIHIRQFHNKKHLGIVHVHFPYKGKRYTLVMRWDHFVPEEQRMCTVRPMLPGEALLRDDELVLFKNDLIQPKAGVTEEERFSLASECAGIALYLSRLDVEMMKDYEAFLQYGKGDYPPKVAYMINTFIKNKTYLTEDKHICRAVNEQIIVGLEKLLAAGIDAYSASYLSRVYKAFTRLALCEPTDEEKRVFKELKSKLIKLIQQKLVKSGLFEVAKQPKERRSRRHPAKELFRGYSSELSNEHKQIVEHALSVIKPFFNGKYISTNEVEGFFGRIKMLVKQHRNILSSPSFLYTVFWRNRVSITNPVRMVSELMQDFPLNYVFEECNKAKYSDDESKDDSLFSVRNYWHGVLEVGKSYEYVYKNRKGEVKCHRATVLRCIRRKKTIKGTWYLVRYHESDEIRVLRGHRILTAREI